MKYWIAIRLTCLAIAPACATPEADEFDERQLYGASACVAYLESRCWKPMADRLAALKKPAATKQERKVLEKLAAIEKRNGKITESAEFSRRAASLAIKEVDITWSDPLNDTLGLPNSARLSD